MAKFLETRDGINFVNFPSGQILPRWIFGLAPAADVSVKIVKIGMGSHSRLKFQIAFDRNIASPAMIDTSTLATR